MKKIKLLMPLVGLTSLASAVIPVVSCGPAHEEHKDVTTYKVGPSEAAAKIISVNVTSIDEGNDLFAIVKVINPTKKIIEGKKPTIKVGDTTISGSDFTFTAKGDFYKLWIDAKAITGDITIDIPASALQSVEKVYIINTFEEDDDFFPVTCKGTDTFDKPGELTDIALSCDMESGGISIHPMDVVTLNDQFGVLERLQYADSIDDTTPAGYWTILSSGDKTMTIRVSKNSFELGGYIAINAFGVQGSGSNFAVGDYAVGFRYDKSKTGDPWVRKEFLPGYYYCKGRAITTNWDGEISFELQEEAIRQDWKFEGVQSAVCGSREFGDDEYAIEITPDGHSMTVTFTNLATLEIIALGTSLKVRPKLGLASDVAFNYGADELGNIIEYSGNLTSTTHKISLTRGYFLQRKLVALKDASETPTLVATINDPSFVFTKSFWVEFGGVQATGYAATLSGDLKECTIELTSTAKDSLFDWLLNNYQDDALFAAQISPAPKN